MRLELLHTQQQIENGLREVATAIIQETENRGLGIIAFHVIYDGGSRVAEFLIDCLSPTDLMALKTSSNLRSRSGTSANEDIEVRPNLTVQDLEQFQRYPQMPVYIIDEINDSGNSAQAIESTLRKLGIKNEIKHVALYSREVGNNKKHPDYFVFTVEGDLFLLGWGMDYNNIGAMEGFVVQLILDSPDEEINEMLLSEMLVQKRHSHTHK